jgi:multiple sugar transport system substrate-binding protein/raffinose/stachyose/melibiose transport system substrate-binding protein
MRKLAVMVAVVGMLALIAAQCTVSPAAVRVVETVVVEKEVVVTPTPAAQAEQAAGEENSVTMMHYFSGTLGRESLNEILGNFHTEAPELTVFDNPIGHEDFKTTILVMLAGGDPPDIFSYWAGARVQFIVDSGRLAPIDDLWDDNNLGEVVPASLAEGATLYNGQRYLIPFGYHYAGMFYNPKVMQEAGVTEFPESWDEFIALCDTLKEAGVTPIALGSMNRWPAQFWFDYLLLRTAGPEYRAKLMAGEASYTDPEVVRVMEMWAELVDKGYFVPDANAYDWTDAADQVANGEAAMTLMGTWITGYWDGNDLKPGEDYDFFIFPAIEEGVPQAALGPVDGFVLSADAQHPNAARKLLLYLITNTDAQATWALGQGALSPNAKVDPNVYTPVMQRALQAVEAADTFTFNYDLATTPPMAEGGLNMFAQFMNDPSGYQEYLEQTQAVADEVFAAGGGE